MLPLVAGADGFVRIAGQFHTLGVATGRAFGLLALVAGAVGYAYAPARPAWRRRCRGLLAGGAAALAASFLAGTVYRTVTFVMLGAGESPGRPGALYSERLLALIPPGAEPVLAAAAAFSRVAGTVGMAAFVFGAGLWAVSAADGVHGRKGTRIVAAGLALMVASVCERLLAVLGHLVLPFYA